MMDSRTSAMPCPIVQLHPLAVGKRKWLFADTLRGARASATIFSLIKTAEANEIEPYEYLPYVLMYIASADTFVKLEALLPLNMKAAIKQ